jgi:hypothetical protein
VQVEKLAGLYYLLGPLIALAVIGVMVLVLRWAFSRGGSLVARRPEPGAESDYGMLTAVAAPWTYAEAEMSRRRLEDAGIRATVAQTVEGPRVMVFARDEPAARRLLARA